MRADTITKDYISDTTVFADVFNYFIYDGEQVIRPEQVEEAARSHRRAMKQVRKQEKADSSVEQKKPSAGEFLSGFWKTDRLIPSVTVMLYFAPDAWDGPLSLFDMMEVKDPRILSFIDNYHVRLIAPAQMMKS